MAEVTTANSWEMPPLCPKCRVPWAAGCSLADCPKCAPSLAGTAETMTGVLCKCGHPADSHVDKGVGAGCMVGGCKCRLRVPHVLSAALAERTAECEALKRESTLALSLQIAQLRHELATAQEDTRRMDWLEKTGYSTHNTLGCNSQDESWESWEVVGKGRHACKGYGDTLREAIDAARPHAAPEGERGNTRDPYNAGVGGPAHRALEAARRGGRK